MGTTVYNKLRAFIKEMDDYKAIKKKLKLFLVRHSSYLVEEFLSL